MKAIKHCLIEKKMKLLELAKTTGIEYSRLSRIVNGWTEARWDEKDAISDALCVDYDDLWAEDEQGVTG
ncbi:MAG: helix-turn-helix domain-containing protein [Planctomycetota bacterium]|jgi:DNA-binding Xre family transcriptional regulator